MGNANKKLSVFGIVLLGLGGIKGSGYFLGLLGFAGLAAFMLGAGSAAAVPVFRAFFPHGITGLGQAMLIITFALGGVVTLGVTAGKTENPRGVHHAAYRHIRGYGACGDYHYIFTQQ